MCIAIMSTAMLSASPFASRWTRSDVVVGSCRDWHDLFRPRRDTTPRHDNQKICRKDWTDVWSCYQRGSPDTKFSVTTQKLQALKYVCFSNGWIKIIVPYSSAWQLESKDRTELCRSNRGANPGTHYVRTQYPQCVKKIGSKNLVEDWQLRDVKQILSGGFIIALKAKFS